jgi:deazaflavin-dependent oxidoreductase (nitroreductase family)
MSRRIVDEPAAPLVDGGYALRVLRTTGRRSAEPRETPIAVVAHDGRLHLVSPDAGRAWVRNLAADPRCALVAADGATRAPPSRCHPRRRPRWCGPTCAR